VNRLFGGPVTQRDNGSALNFTIHSNGFLPYRVMGQARHEFRPPLGTVVVQDFCHTTDQAHIELLETLLGLEMFHDIEIEVSVDDPLPLKLSDQRAAHTTGVSDFLWLRIMNVPDVLGTRAYPADADVVLEVTDPLGVAGGRSLLQTRDGAGTCKPHQGPPTSKSVWLTWERSSWVCIERRNFAERAASMNYVPVPYRSWRRPSVPSALRITARSFKPGRRHTVCCGSPRNEPV
jgi:hypothetical protein